MHIATVIPDSLECHGALMASKLAISFFFLLNTAAVVGVGDVPRRQLKLVRLFFFFFSRNAAS